jgi:23S rRNA pseudouridine1911/1915/1917 synthase
LVLAKTSKAAQRINKEFATRTVGKYYLALVLGEPKESGRLINDLYRDGRLTRLAQDQEKGSRAELSYQVVAQGLFQKEKAALLSVKLKTGFKHQIRTQLAILGYPIVGDWLYGGLAGPSTVIGLWAYRLELTHPITKDRLTFMAWPPLDWPWSDWRGPDLASLDWSEPVVTDLSLV